MSPSQTFRLLADVSATSSASKSAIRLISGIHYPAAHQLFARSDALCDSTLGLLVDRLRASDNFSGLNLVELASASPTLRIFRPTDPGDVATALRSMHGSIAEQISQIDEVASMAHADLAAALSGAQETPVISRP